MIPSPAKDKPAPRRRRWFDTFILPASLLPAVSMGLLGISRGSIIAFLSLYALEMGGDPGIWFSVFAVAVVVGRPIFGPLSDRKGRPFVVIPTYLLALVGMLVLVVARSPMMLLVSAGILGFGYGSVHAALMTMAIDLAPRDRWGLSMAQYHLFYDLAIGGGGGAGRRHAPLYRQQLSRNVPCHYGGGTGRFYPVRDGVPARCVTLSSGVSASSNGHIISSRSICNLHELATYRRRAPQIGGCRELAFVYCFHFCQSTAIRKSRRRD